MTTPTFNRRSLFGMVGAAALVAGAPAFAATNAQARALVDRLVADINSAIGSGGSDAAMINAFENIFATYADVPTIALSCLGPTARSASNAQKQAYITAFRGYISRKYGKRFREFIGGRIEVTGAQAVNSWIEVPANAYLRGQSPFEVKFLVSDRSGSLRFFDMFIEGISMRVTERTEILAMLDAQRGSLDALISNLSSAG